MIWLVTERGKRGRKPMESHEVCLVNRKRELYFSLFYSGNEIKEFIQKNGSPAGFNGRVYGHHFVVDFDGKDVSRVAKTLLPLLADLHNLQIVHYLFYSGSKGFHLYVPKAYVEYPAELEDKWNLACRSFAVGLKDHYPELTEFLDETIYDKQRIFRFPYSVHPEKNKQKYLLTYNLPENYQSIPAEEVPKLFKPSEADHDKILHEIFNGFHPPVQPDEVLFDITEYVDDAPEPISPYREDRDEIGEGLVAVSRYAAKECITAMLNSTHLTGSRHNVLLRLSDHFFSDLGFSKELTMPALFAWNKRLDDPMPEEDIVRIVDKYHGNYDYGCNDDVKKKFCNPQCMYYKTCDTQKNHMYYGDSYFTVLEEAMNAPTHNDIVYHRMYPELIISPSKPDRGHVVVIAAGPSVGKTTFALNMMLRYPHINWMFMSYEMSGDDIADKLWTICFGNEEVNESRREEFKRKTSHIVTIDNPMVRIGDIPKTWEMVKAQTGKECKGIIIDYLQLAPVGGAIATERAIAIAKASKEMAKQLKVTPYLLSQVPKELAGDGNEPLPMQAPKDSGEITNLADLQLNLWRPYRNKPKEGIDNVLRVYVAKNRHGEACQLIDLNWIGHSYRVEPMLTGQAEVTSKEAA